MDGTEHATVRAAGEAAVLSILRDPGDGAVGAPGGRSPGRGAGTDPVGNGDDAAVLGPAAATVLSTDMLVEGTHFRTDLSGWRDIGRRAVVQNVSDIAAMGADCSHLLVAVCLPPGLPLRDVRELAGGLHAEAARHGARIVGGDLTCGPVAMLTVTAVGTLGGDERPVRIDGARAGDRIALTGRPGRGAAGLELLLAGHRQGPLQQLYRVPELSRSAGPAARRAGASALTDVSDGLLRDLSGLAAASGVSADLDSGALPVDPALSAAATLLGAEDAAELVRRWVLDGGEDHGLLAAFPAGVAIPEEFTVVGRFGAGQPGVVRVDGRPRRAAGWDSTRGDGAAH